MKARLERLLRRLGAAGVLGIGVLIGCAGFYFNGLGPAEAEARVERLALQRARTPSANLPVSAAAPDEQLQHFYGLFPTTAQLADEVEHLHKLAGGAGLQLAEGEYRLERRDAGLWAYRITLPVRGSYAQLRAFLSALLSDMPATSIDALRFERRRANDSQLEAQLRITLHTRPSGEVQ